MKIKRTTFLLFLTSICSAVELRDENDVEQKGLENASQYLASLTNQEKLANIINKIDPTFVDHS